ncbi:DeoR/GlpR family DNA-binding transcription regulator [Arthrobacter sp. StoSoilB5]|uniref:DeoR/GlpR family DNA-binding transcription regulator n=1 Tax=Arthrobacter sp. StoSoilB5 TaxID=2830992 RepID=UPI0021E180C8|nr:DeoR/GlpR family DNA-binding transcription regulator [Arthrobacter sp. StoSoilB5]
MFRLHGTGVVSTEDLAQSLSVSNETIRRDLALLEKRGLLSRVHGGATAPLPLPPGEEPPFAERANVAGEAKDRIGKAAATLLKPGQFIVLDVGTTALSVARSIPTDFRGTVATSSLLVAIELSNHPNLVVHVAGGRLRGGDMALSNSNAQNFFRDLHPDIAFLGSGGVDAKAGLTDYYLEEAAARKVIVQNSAVSYILADSSKFGRVARHRVSGLNELAGLITESEPPAEIREELEKHNGVILIA